MTTKTSTPKELIVKRESLISDIKKNWQRLATYNSVEKGLTRDYDLKEVYKQIVKDSKELINVKVALQAVNMGLTSLDELKKDNVYVQVYLLSQLKEQKVKLNLLPTRGDDVVFTKAYIMKETKVLEGEILKIEDELEKFNSNKQIKL